MCATSRDDLIKAEGALWKTNMLTEQTHTDTQTPLGVYSLMHPGQTTRRNPKHKCSVLANAQQLLYK